MFMSPSDSARVLTRHNHNCETIISFYIRIASQKTATYYKINSLANWTIKYNY